MGFLNILNIRETSFSPKLPGAICREAAVCADESKKEKAGGQNRSPSGFWYGSAQGLRLEKELLFENEWMALTPTDAILDAKFGGEFERDGQPVHLRRDPESGALTALSLVCRHRGATVQPRALGKGLCFVCPYHGWTYGDDGSRLFCPEWPAAAAEGQPGLQGWDCQEWAGFAWLKKRPSGVAAAPQTRLPPGPWNVPPGRPEEFDLNGLQWHGTWWDELACDWKVFVDNYLDGGYHLGPVHPELSGALDGSAYRTEVADRAVLQWAPSATNKAEGMAEVRSGSEARYWWIWPNFFWNHYGDCLDTNVVYPAGPGKCRVRFDFFFSGFGRFASQAQRTKSIEAAKLIQEQDRQVCESVQRGMESGDYQGGPYHPIKEIGMRRFHQLWREALGLPGDES